MQYDEQVLHQHAEQLYKEATAIIYSTATKYGIFTGLASFGVVAVLHALSQVNPDVPWNQIAVAITVIAIALGIAEGKRRAFLLKLEAQRILVLAEIERNTRRAPSEIAAPPIEQKSHA
jgi:hypothetical protein